MKHHRSILRSFLVALGLGALLLGVGCAKSQSCGDNRKPSQGLRQKSANQPSDDRNYQSKQWILISPYRSG